MLNAMRYLLLTGRRRFVFAILLSASLVALNPTGAVGQTVAKAAPSATLHGDKAHPAHGAHWVDTQLYFGLGPADRPDAGVSEAAWREFLDTEVTPRFPSGLSVLDVYGQWLGKGAAKPERIRSKMLIIDYPATAENAARVEAIRVAWKKRTGDQSVLKVTQPADVSF
jgi:hypothetical protein